MVRFVDVHKILSNFLLEFHKGVKLCFGKDFIICA